MDNQEKVNYIRRCIEFLDLTHDRNSDTYRYKDILITDTSAFHSNWNHVMMLVEAIETKAKASFIIKSLWNEFNSCTYTQATIHIEKGEMSKDKKCIYNSVDIYKYHSHSTESKKEAVIEVINNFLIWYNNKQ